MHISDKNNMKNKKQYRKQSKWDNWAGADSAHQDLSYNINIKNKEVTMKKMHWTLKMKTFECLMKEAVEIHNAIM